MKRLSDFKDEINRCSKCGLCQGVCPVYKVTGNDCAVSRGKFVMLDGVMKGDLKLSKNINKYLDMCLKCDKCKNFCPSEIDVCKIFETAKYEFVKNTVLGKIIFFLESNFVFGNFIRFFRTFSKDRNYKNASNSLKLLYFKGCVGNIFPKTNSLLKKLKSKLDIELIEKDFDCCGIPFLSSGNLKRYEEVKEKNLRLMDCEYDYIFTDCASCESTLKNYFDIEPKFINLGELLVKNDIQFKFEKPIKVTFHKPCHLENIDFVKKLFENCENVQYVEMKNYNDCCGFAGEFALKNPKLSKIISEEKAQNIINTGADYVITTCPSCILGLKQGLFYKKSPIKVLSLAAFLLMSKNL